MEEEGSVLFLSGILLAELCRKCQGEVNIRKQKLDTNVYDTQTLDMTILQYVAETHRVDSSSHIYNAPLFSAVSAVIGASRLKPISRHCFMNPLDILR